MFGYCYTKYCYETPLLKTSTISMFALKYLNIVK